MPVSHIHIQNIEYSYYGSNAMKQVCSYNMLKQFYVLAANNPK